MEKDENLKEKQATEAMIKNYQEKKKNKIINILAFLLPFLALLVLLRFCLVPAMIPYVTMTSVKESIWMSYVVSVMGGIISVLSVQFVYGVKIENYELRLIFWGIEDAKENVDEDIYQNLIKISYKYLDEYYLQTRQQAQNGFFVTMSVSVMGAIVIALGIGAMFFGKTTPAYVTTASGVITEFIAAIFFYLYNKTISSMRDYHNKLVLSQNISIALKITESMSKEQGEKVKEHIVEELVKDINTYIHSEN